MNYKVQLNWPMRERGEQHQFENQAERPNNMESRDNDLFALLLIWVQIMQPISFGLILYWSRSFDFDEVQNGF